MEILDDMGVSKLSPKVFSKVNYSFKFFFFFFSALQDLMATGVTVDYSEQMCHWSTSSLLIGERH